jgi:hypothetical protein
MAVTASLTTGKEPVQGPNLIVGRGQQITIQADPRNKALVFVSDEKSPVENGFILEPGAQLGTQRNPKDFYFASEGGVQSNVRFLVN